MRHPFRGLLLLSCLLCLVSPAPAQTLSPQARRDLSVLATAYPGVIQAVEVAPGGRATVVLADGARLPYDDGRPRSAEESVEDPDLKTILAQPYPLGPVAAEPPLWFSPGRQRAQALFFALYGHTQAEVRAACRPVPFFNQSIPFNARQGAADAFARVSTRLEKLAAADPGIRKYLLPASGGMVWRVIAGTDRLSAHAFAAAVDVSPRGNPYWRNLPRGRNMLAVRQAFPPSVVAAFEAEGFIWGGKWAEFDLMHFEYRPEIILLARLARGETPPLASIDALLRPGR
ncbi:M15 family metallopeptidase [Solidesulfovibrio sp.]|uniref:M15 family metallopeptidase n=1 Tax=Solidesulfovibrio sp. TaxID=2910990 RepID=UPI00260B54B6|nr:M15 family metallopeptidase [Solidesulfovibrio sp.]